MENVVKTKELIEELEALRQRVAELEQSEAERKQAEEALRQSEAQYSALVENSKDAIIIIQDGVLKFINAASVEIIGYPSEEMIGASFLDFVIPDYRELILKRYRDRMEGKEVPSVYEIELLRKDGMTVPVEVNANLIDFQGKPADLAFIRGINERKQPEEKLRHAAEEWRATFDSITDLVSIHDKDFRLMRVNKAFADAFKMKPQEVIGKPCYEIVHGTNEPIPNCPHKQTLEDGKPHRAEYFEPHLGIHLEVATSPIFDDKGEVIGTVHIAKDITERKQTEAQLIVTDRLASVGELASGIAHELNNPLTSVIGFAQLVLDKDVADDVREDIAVIYREAQRTAEVVKNLLTFAGKHTPVKQMVNINSIIDKVLALRAYEQKVNNIEVVTHFDPDLPEIMADYFQLQQVFLNIIINAEHFMIEAHHGGTLTITTERAGDIIMASFADDGPGIGKENLGHVFDPFFTTKEIGKGTGLGLSICHGIITEHGGRIYAESELGKGATFVMELPIGNYG